MRRMIQVPVTRQSPIGASGSRQYSETRGRYGPKTYCLPELRIHRGGGTRGRDRGEPDAREGSSERPSGIAAFSGCAAGVPAVKPAEVRTEGCCV